jgi:hypothetical protein
MKNLLLFTIAASAGVLAVGTAVIQPAGALDPCGSIAAVQQGKTFQHGVPLAGRVQGCIDCHADAPGDDFVFSHNRYGRQ